MKTKKIRFDCISNELSTAEMRGIMAGSGGNGGGSVDSSNLVTVGANWDDFNLGINVDPNTGNVTISPVGGFGSMGGSTTQGAVTQPPNTVPFVATNTINLYMGGNLSFQRYNPNDFNTLPTTVQQAALVADAQKELSEFGISTSAGNVAYCIGSVLTQAAPYISQAGGGAYGGFIQDAINAAVDIWTKGVANAPINDWVKVSMGMLAIGSSLDSSNNQNGLHSNVWNNVVDGWIYQDNSNALISDAYTAINHAAGIAIAGKYN